MKNKHLEKQIRELLDSLKNNDFSIYDYPEILSRIAYFIGEDLIAYSLYHRGHAQLRHLRGMATVLQ